MRGRRRSGRERAARGDRRRRRRARAHASITLRLGALRLRRRPDDDVVDPRPRRRSPPPTARARLLARTAQNLSPVSHRSSVSLAPGTARARRLRLRSPLTARSRPERLLPRIALTVDSRPIRQIPHRARHFFLQRALGARRSRARAIDGAVDGARRRGRGRRTVATVIDERGAERRRNARKPAGEDVCVHASRSSRVSRGGRGEV